MPYLVLLILSLPVLEIYFTVWMFSLVGLLWGSAWLIADIVVGSFLLRQYKLALLLTSWQDLRHGQMTPRSILGLVRYYLAAILIFIPGFLSDILAIVLLLWPLPAAKVPLNEVDPDVLEGEFHRVDDHPDDNRRLKP